MDSFRPLKQPLYDAVDTIARRRGVSVPEAELQLKQVILEKQLPLHFPTISVMTIGMAKSIDWTSINCQESTILLRVPGPRFTWENRNPPLQPMPVVVEVSVVDQLWPERSARSQTKGSRGRRPTLRLRVEAHMRDKYVGSEATLAVLRNMKEKQMAAEFGCSRDTARKARKAVVPDIPDHNSRQ